MAWHNYTYFGGWFGRFQFHEHNMSFTWSSGVLYHVTKMLNIKYKIKQTVKFLIDARLPLPMFNYTIHQDVMRAEVNHISQVTEWSKKIDNFIIIVESNFEVTNRTIYNLTVITCICKTTAGSLSKFSLVLN